MEKIHGHKKIRTAVGLMMFVFLTLCWALPAMSQAPDKKENTAVKKVEVLQTEVGLDQIIKEPPKAAPAANAPSKTAQEGIDLLPEEQQIIAINKSLKNVLEENQKLTQERQALEKELGQLRGESEIRANRINFLSRQREDLQKQTEEARALDSQKAKELADLKAALEQKEKEYQEKLQAMQNQAAQKEQEQKKAMEMVLPRKDAKGAKDKDAVVASPQDLTQIKKQTQENLTRVEQNVKKVATRISQLNKENKKLKKDSAKLHYNLANTFFERGLFEKAAREYRKVVDLLPYDAAAHYNLAFVCGEFLNDYQTALEHYRQYLYLNPDAEDEELVKEKILEAGLNLRARVNSPIDQEAPYGEVKKHIK
ncbi:MAG TPA: hypothetical protein PL155_00020 [Candidatus Omnitrophota bacterium]|nr:hypothetical protein [Candidatus Omnitrophota bacterium]HPD85128.1 hypothetical protein [Candidatus Omnitrophota bacterium]HRZ03986.1 hypothetical protein [Candidatus Omnitrophota bacterium]